MLDFIIFFSLSSLSESLVVDENVVSDSRLFDHQQFAPCGVDGDLGGGRFMVVNETTACPEASDGSDLHNESLIPPTDRRSRVITPSSPILWKMQLFTRPRTSSGRCCGNCVINATGGLSVLISL